MRDTRAGVAGASACDPRQERFVTRAWRGPGSESTFGRVCSRPRFHGRQGHAACDDEAHGEAISGAVDVLTEIIIERPRAEVAAYAGNPDHAPGWYVSIKSVERTTPPPLAVGSRIAFVAHFLFRQLAYTYELIDVVPGERLVMRTVEGPFAMETTYTWAAMSDRSTRVTLRNRGDPRGFGKLMAPFMALAMRRANRKDLARLKDILEGRTGEG